jgi:hypothetical protein
LDADKKTDAKALTAEILKTLDTSKDGKISKGKLIF